MKQGKQDLTALAVELQRQQDEKRDFVADTRKLTLTPFDDQNELTSNIRMLIQDEKFPMNNTAHQQIAARLNIPKDYYNRMMEFYPDLLVDNVNYLFDKVSDRRMIRTLDGNVRAFLSERYRCLDNFDLANCVLPILNDSNQRIEIVSSEITERRMYIKVLFPDMERKIDVKVGDVVQSGIVISNSEIGHGSLRVEPLLFILACLNGMISSSSLKKYHVGRAIDDSEDGNAEIFRDETLKQDDKAFWMKIEDTIRASISDVEFKRAIERVEVADGNRIACSPIDIVERAKKTFSLTESEGGNVLTHLIEGADLSMWGLCNAITRTSQDVKSYDRATDLERLGGRIIELPKSDWNTLSKAA